MQENLHLTSNIDIVCFSLMRWDAPVSSPAVSLAKEFSKKHRVFFINHPHSLKDVATYLPLARVRREAKSKPAARPRVDREGNITIITPPVTLPINFLPEGRLYNWMSSLNNSVVLKTLRLVIKEMGVKQYVFINFFDPFFLQKLPDDILPLRYVYQCMDDMSQVEYTRRHGIKLENEVIKHADITLCTSNELTELKSLISSRVYFHPNAADIELFNTAFGNSLTRPADLPVTDKRIIGFAGSIEYRTDFDLLRKIALQHRDKLLYLVGPVTGDEHIKAGLTEMDNVLFAGAKKITELPAYIQYFDCCIIPYKINTLTRSIYPLKINEYLAAGKPVIATNFSEDIYSFNDVAYIANDHDTFIADVNKAINEDDQNKRYQRLNRASQNSWTKRVADFWKIILPL